MHLCNNILGTLECGRFKNIRVSVYLSPSWCNPAYRHQSSTYVASWVPKLWDGDWGGGWGVLANLCRMARLFPSSIFTEDSAHFWSCFLVIGRWTRIGKKGTEFMAVSNGQGLASGPILWGDVGQIFKLGINGHTNTQICCVQIQTVQRLGEIEFGNSIPL